MIRFALCAVLAAGTLGIAGVARATELDPGGTLQISQLSAGTSGESVDFLWGYVSYEQPPTTTRRVAYYDMIQSSVGITGDGQIQLVYNIAPPLFGSRPPSPGDPVISVYPFPSDTTISLSNFGLAPVDVASISLPGWLPIDGVIHRSADGSVITLSSLSGLASDGGDFAPRNELAFMVGGNAAYIEGNATVSLTDQEGRAREIAGSVFVPFFDSPPTALPEPSSCALLGVALLGWAWRGKRARG